MTTQNQIKQQIITLLDALPMERLEEVADFVEFLRAKHTPQKMPYIPIALGSLWAGVSLSDEDIEEVREEMWRNFGEREP